MDRLEQEGMRCARERESDLCVPAPWRARTERVVIDLASSWAAFKLHKQPMSLEWSLSQGRRFVPSAQPETVASRFLEAQLQEAVAGVVRRAAQDYAVRHEVPVSSLRAVDAGSQGAGLAQVLCRTLKEVYRLRCGSPAVRLAQDPDNLHIIPAPVEALVPEPLVSAFQIAVMYRSPVLESPQDAMDVLHWAWDSLDSNALMVIALPGPEKAISSMAFLDEIEYLAAGSQGKLCHICMELVLEAQSRPARQVLDALGRALRGSLTLPEGADRLLCESRLLVLHKGPWSAAALSAGREDVVLDVQFSPHRPVTCRVEAAQPKSAPPEWNPSASMRAACRTLNRITPAQIVEILDSFNEHDVARSDRTLKEALARVGVPRVLYLEWLQDDPKIRAHAQPGSGRSWAEIKAGLQRHKPRRR